MDLRGLHARVALLAVSADVAPESYAMLGDVRPGLSSIEPYRVSECARFMGVSSEWIRKAITLGRPVAGGLVKLTAEATMTHTRPTYRIHEHEFLRFLQAIGWKHLPAGVPASPGTERPSA
jgi:hypothetical protein